MAKLVVLSAGLAGRTHELTVDKTTIGRVEDNTFQIAEQSVSSHHCEILLRGSDVVVKDLNSTNGTFINGEKVSGSVLKPGQVLRLGQIEIRLEDGAGVGAAPAAAAAPAPAPAAAPGSLPSKKLMDSTLLMQRGVSLSELKQGPRTAGFDTASKAFSKKSNKANKWIFIAAGVVIALIGVVLLIAFLQAQSGSRGP
jgi:predicted component of type VI protein secretion system